jgi:hypothetical protein
LLASIQCLRDTNTVYDVVIIWEAPYTAKEQSAFEALNVTRVCMYVTLLFAIHIRLAEYGML